MRTSAPEARWILREPDSVLLEALRLLAPQRHLPRLILRLLALRGLGGVEPCERFLEPRLAALGDPFVLPGMADAVQRLFQAVDRSERVVLYGDYDVDGVTSLTLMTHTLEAYGLQPKAFLPLRMEEGYGLSKDGLARCFEEHGKPALLVALDCGTSSVNETAWLAEHGVDCVIVDHHEPGATFPQCAALVNPKLGQHYHYLCTVGLVFKLAHALMKTRRLEHFDLKDYLDLVAMGTVADLVPLRDENRVFVRKGLEKLAVTRRAGLRALKAVAGIQGNVYSHHVGFRLGPRLNAAGRLDTAQTSLNLLLSDDFDEARRCAVLLDTHNRERQEVEEKVHREAREMLAAYPELTEHSCIVLGSRSWHPGVVGIVASRIMREYHRPTLLVAFAPDGVGKGSGRSVPGISLVDAINGCRELLLKGGGHAMAVGITVEEKHLEGFRLAMSACVDAMVMADELAPRVDLDAEVTLAELTEGFLEHYAALEPFGMGNEEPTFLCRGVDPILPGQVLKGKHWKLLLKQDGITRPCMWFNAPVTDAPSPPWDMVLRLQRHEFRGEESWQLLVSDVRSTEEPFASAAASFGD